MTARLRLTLIFGVLAVLASAYGLRSTRSPVAVTSEPLREDTAKAASSVSPSSAVDSMRSALRNLAVGQEAYFAEHSRYAGSMEELLQGGGGYYRATTGVSVVLQATSTGWSAVASSTLTDSTCRLAMPPEGPGDGGPKC